METLTFLRRENFIKTTTVLFLFVFAIFKTIVAQDHSHTASCISIEDRAHQTTIQNLVQQVLTSSSFNNRFEDTYHCTATNFLELNSFFVNQIEYEIINYWTANTPITHELVENLYFERIDYYRSKDELLFEIPSDHNITKIYYGKNVYNPIDRGSSSIPKTASCLNAGFEENSWNGWQTYCGIATNGYNVLDITPYTPPAACGVPANTPLQHVLWTAGNDAIGGFSRVFNGGVSAMIGNGPQANNPQHQAAVLRKQFVVDPNNTIITYNYAAVLDNRGGHTATQQPFFNVRLLVNGASVPCAAYSATAGDGQQGWVNAGNIFYRDWTTIAVPLEAYIGQTVELEFSVSDCFVGGGTHYAYAYIDVSCNNLEIEQYCNGSSTTLSAPTDGITNYLWNTGETTPSITITTPGTYSVDITPYGSICPVTITYNASVFPAPVAQFDLNHPSICVGGDIDFISNSTVDPGGTITGYLWDFGDGISTPEGIGTITGVAQTNGTYINPNHSYNTIGNYNISMTVFTENGCSDTYTQQISVIQGPQATIAGNTIICENETAPNITFTGSQTSPPFTFTYNINGGASQTVTTSTTTATVPAPIVPGTYIYNLTYVSSSSSAMCEQAQAGEITVVVNPQPTASITQDAVVCQNDQNPILTFTGLNGTSNYQFTYSLNGGANQTISTTNGSNVTINVPTNTSGTFDYELISVQDISTGCTTTLNSGSQLATIIVNPMPNATIANDATVCQNASSPMVNFTGTNSSSNYTFTYTINSGGSQTTTSDIGTPSATINAITTTPGTYTYQLTNVADPSTGCNLELNQAVTITVNPLPAATISQNAIVCEQDQNPVVTFTGSLGTSDYQFTYTLNSGTTQTINSTGTSNTASITVPTTNAGSYSYQLTEVMDIATGCLVNYGSTGQTADIIVNPKPTGTIAGTTTVCQNDNAPTITFSGTNSSANYTFTYILNGGTTQTISNAVGTNQAIITVPTSVAGTYNYQLVNVSDPLTGCNSTVDQTISILVNPLPAATISQNAIVCEQDQNPVVTFTGSLGTSDYQFTYTLNSGITQTINSTGTSNSASITVPTTNAGSYSYQLTEVMDIATGCLVNYGSTGQTADIIVNPKPTGTIAGTTTVCQNDNAPTITFSGTNSSANYTFTYILNGGTTQTISNAVGTNQAIITVPTSVAGTYNYQLVNVSDPLTGCSSTVDQTVSILVNPLPAATIYGTTTLCQNETNPTIEFIGTNGTADYTFTYSVNGGSGLTISTSNSNTASITIPTNIDSIYVFELLSVSDIATGCFQNQSGLATITINPVPSASISGTIDVCKDAPAPIVTFTGLNSSTNYVFAYQHNNGPVQTITSAPGTNQATLNQVTNVSGIFQYQLIGVSDGTTLCNAPLNESITIDVKPLPIATISPSVEACHNDSLNLEVTFTGSIGDAPFTFNYTLNGAPLQVTTTGSSITLPIPTSAVGTSTFVITSVQEGSVLGCQQTQNVISHATVHPLPSVFAGNPITVCANVPVVLTGSGALTYIWNNNVTNGVPFIPTDTTTYTVIGTDINGCTNIDSTTVNVVPIPQMDFSAVNTYGCSPVTPTFTNHSTGNLTNCTWYLGNSQTLQNCDSISAVFEYPGCFDITLTVSTPEGCTNTLTIPNLVCVEANPIAAFHPNPAILSTYDWKATMVNESSGATTYHWEFGDGTGPSTLHSPSHAYPNNEGGFYNITLIATSPAGCVDTAYATVEVKDELLFYVPNSFTPDGDQFNETFKPIFTTGYDPQGYTLYIFNRWGELIFESHDTDIGWNGRYGIDSSLCQDGTYVWTIDIKKKKSSEILKFNGHVNLLR